MFDINSIRKANLVEANDKIVAKLGDDFEPLSDIRLSYLLFRNSLSDQCDESITSHLQAIKLQLDKVLSTSYLKDDVLFEEFSKSLTIFDDLTKSIGLTGHTHAMNYITSQNIYSDAISSYQKCTINFHVGDINFSYIPLKLRLAIEFHFKNMLGFVVAKKTTLTGKKKGEISNYPLSISELLSFYAHRKYKKYVNLPLEISIIRDINYWSNNLVHTGIHSFSWQSLMAIDLLAPLFTTTHKDGSRNLGGFNYLNLDFEQEQMVEDLNKFLSTKFKKIEVYTYQRNSKPIEGGYY